MDIDVKQDLNINYNPDNTKINTAKAASKEKVQAQKTQQARKLLTINQKAVSKQIQSNIITTQSLPKPQENFDITNTEIMFAQLRSKLNEQVDKGSVNDIRLNMKRLKSENKKLISKLQAHLKKLEERKHRSLLAKIFGWIGAILGTVVGAVAAIFTGGASIGLLVAGIVGLTVCTLNETGTLQKITSALSAAITKSLIADGVDPAKAKKVGMILAQVVVAAAVIIASVGGGSISSDLGPLVQLSQRALSVAQMASKAGMAATALSGIGAGTSQIMSGVSQSQGMTAQAETMDIKGIINSLQSVINANVKSVDDVTKGNNTIVKKVNNIISSQIDSRQYVVSNV